MEREALKLVLEALQFSGNIWHMDCKKDEAIAAIEEALAQPAQEPMAWQWLGSAQFRKKIPKNGDKTAWNPLYTTPPAAQRTEQEPVQFNCTVVDDQHPQGIPLEQWREFASDYERGVIDGRQKQMQSSVDKAVNAMTQRTWVSLTDDQIKEIVGPWGDTPIKGYTRKLIDQIDAKLRENNNG
jgi:hypothetical protein